MHVNKGVLLSVYIHVHVCKVSLARSRNAIQKHVIDRLSAVQSIVCDNLSIVSSCVHVNTTGIHT